MGRSLNKTLADGKRLSGGRPIVDYRRPGNIIKLRGDTWLILFDDRLGVVDKRKYEPFAFRGCEILAVDLGA